MKKCNQEVQYAIADICHADTNTTKSRLQHVDSDSTTLCVLGSLRRGTFFHIHRHNPQPLQLFWHQ